jgi:penicillin-binding protein 1A
MIKKIKEAISKLFSPIRNVFSAIVAPIKPLYKPISDRWDAFSEKKPTLSKWIGRFLKVVVAFYAVILSFNIGVFGECPSVNDLKALQNKNASEIYSVDSVLLGRFYFENRTNVKYEAISKDVINALVATEDVRFFQHSGIDYKSWLRVLFKSILSQDDAAGGGSTISQQLAKNLFPRKKYWAFSILINKMREMIIATRLEKAFNKQDLVTFYLNTVPFGDNAYGIEVASKRYFSKTPSTLSTQESAVLVGTLKATSLYNPRRNPKNATSRRNVVFNQMVKYNYLNSDVADSLKKLPLELNYNKQSDGGLAAYFREYLKLELPKILNSDAKDSDALKYDIFNDGLKIYTTIDSKLQKFAEEAVEEHMSKIQNVFDNSWRGQKAWVDDKYIYEAMKTSSRYKLLKDDGQNEEQILKNFNTPTECTIFSWKGDVTRKMTPLDSVKYYYCLLNTGFLAADPKTGNIKAWVGGNDFKFMQYDHVNAKRQVGSTFKPIVYAAALKSGIPPCEEIPNKVLKFRYYNDRWVTIDSVPKGVPEDPKHKDWEPHNVDESYGGSYSMKGALTKSVNVATVATILKTGVKPVVDLARSMGIVSPIIEEPSIALGTADISLYEMISVYGTFANRGVQCKLNPLQSISTFDGKKIYDSNANQPKREKVLSDDYADMMVDMLKSVINQGTGGSIRYAYGVTGDFAGKTGTTQNNADGWFIGFSPDIVVGAWVGAESQVVRFKESHYGQGAYTALPICGHFLQKTYSDPSFAYFKSSKFPKPSPWVTDSLNCPLRMYAPGEAIDTLIDTTEVLEIPDSIDAKIKEAIKNAPGLDNNDDFADDDEEENKRQIKAPKSDAAGKPNSIPSSKDEKLKKLEVSPATKPSVPELKKKPNQ